MKCKEFPRHLVCGNLADKQEKHDSRSTPVGKTDYRLERKCGFAGLLYGANRLKMATDARAH